MNSSYLLQIQNYPAFYHKIRNPSYIYIYTIAQMCGVYINVITFKSKPTISVPYRGNKPQATLAKKVDDKSGNERHLETF